MSVRVVLLQLKSLIGGEPLSQITSRGSMLQAPESCWRRCCRDDIGHGVISLPSYAGNGAAEATWSWRDAGVESCW
jgi:hypothetical protein